MHGSAYQVQDDLANLLNRNLNLNRDSSFSHPEELPRQENAVASSAPPSQNIVYSVSQHYNHSAHVARCAQPSDVLPKAQPQRPASEPPGSRAFLIERTLSQLGINTAALTPSQIRLFDMAEDSQKLRLLQLWSICPPARPEDIPAPAWSSTSLDTEEQIALIRLSRSENPAMSLDGTIVQTSDGRWGQRQMSPDGEPYMVSGYEELMRRDYERQADDDRLGNPHHPSNYSKATDPVYRGPSYNAQQQQLDMASQYGAFEQSRGAQTDEDAMEV